MNMEESIKVLIEALNKKEEYLSKLLIFTKEQEVNIKNDDEEKLSILIQKKQNLIDQINELDDFYTNEYNQFKKIIDIDNIDDCQIKKYPVLKELIDCKENILNILKEIDKKDQENMKNLQVNLETVKKKMKELKQNQKGRKIASSYTRRYADVQGIFIDHK